MRDRWENCFKYSEYERWKFDENELQLDATYFLETTAYIQWNTVQYRKYFWGQCVPYGSVWARYMVCAQPRSRSNANNTM